MQLCMCTINRQNYIQVNISDFLNPRYLWLTLVRKSKLNLQFVWHSLSTVPYSKLLIPTAWGHIDKQTPADIAMEITHFEDSARRLFYALLLLLFSSVEFCCNGLCAISWNFPFRNFFPGTFFKTWENWVPLTFLIRQLVNWKSDLQNESNQIMKRKALLCTWIGNVFPEQWLECVRVCAVWCCCARLWWGGAGVKDSTDSVQTVLSGRQAEPARKIHQDCRGTTLSVQGLIW